MVDGVRNVDIAGAVHSQPLRHVEPRQCGRAPIAAEACCTCTRKGGNPSVLTNFTYTLETLIQASHKNIAIAHVPIRVNGKLRESRLFHGIGAYVTRSIGTMIRVYLLYRPLRFFLTLSALALAASLALFVRFLVLFALKPLQTGHVQSLVVAGVFAVVGVLLLALGVLSDLIAMNRILLEEIVVNTRLSRLEREAHERSGAGNGA